MTIPDYQKFMTPLLQLTADRKEHSLKETYDRLAEHFELTSEERTELLPSGRQETYKNRIGWARTYLSKAGLLENTRRGHFRITDRGLDELRHHAHDISSAYLKKFEEFAAFQAPKQENLQKNTPANDPSPTSDATPEEKIESGITELNSQLAADILDALHEASPSFFERVVVELLVAMGIFTRSHRICRTDPEQGGPHRWRTVGPADDRARHRGVDRQFLFGEADRYRLFS